MFALIMAGGSGTRLWPLSRKNSPKQLLKIIDNNTLLQTTFARLGKGFSASQIFVATTSQYAPAIAKQLPKIPKHHYSVEPVLKDRGPAIALAALIMSHSDPKAVFVTAWSDHYIKNEPAYFAALRLAEKFLKQHGEYFLTIGVKPTFPHTGFGYIKMGKKLPSQGVYNVDAFKEKPDFKTAQKFFKSGKHLWNTGYFVCRVDTLLNLYKQYQPEIYKILMQIKPFIGGRQQQTIINKFYPQMPHVDIERGLIEKLRHVAVIPAGFGWADIGSWKVVKDVLSIEDDNLTHGLVAHHNTKKSLIYNYENKLVAVVGAENLVVVNTKDALLIASKDRSEEIKHLVKKLGEDKKLKKYL